MYLNKWTLVVCAVLLFPGCALAGDEKDPQAYCAFLMEQAQAQRDLLRTPTATAGFTQPETGLPMQVVGGVSLGLSDLKKAGLTMEAARKNCELYRTATEAQLEIQYALSDLEREALRNRLKLIERASKSLDELTEKTGKMLEAQNATRLMLFTLQTSKIKLNGDRADTQSKIAAIYVPPLSGAPLKELVSQKQNGELEEQKALDRLNRQNAWDVALLVGVHQQVNPVAQGAQAYGEVTVSYNLASHAYNKHLDRAVQDHDAWKREQESDVVRSMEALRQQLAASVAAQESKLKAFEEQEGQLDKSLEYVVNPDTSAALDFNNQLTAAKLLLGVEVGDASFRIAALQDYLARNY